ncbi:roadblock/LC7 domain-containing protein, putative [Eimeria brunetti]|uniref:Roadblock/LC7 domain-containing protein, putative n=1 Tax=Eimeria brunetti TaxID=51314 RepID=U6LJP8_9EIME|nr:roadblock/LC7 domain-containing protein, putative [Eimeria brunetti]
MSGSQNEADDVLRAWLSNNPSVVGYVVVNPDGLTGDLTTVRLRTKEGLEIITCQIASGYSLIAIQNCTDKPYISDDAAQAAVADGQEGQEAERDG